MGVDVLKFVQSYCTDIGIKRTTNQDSLAILKADTDFGEVLLCVICDGMGGHQFGELASKILVKKFERWFKNDFPLILYNNLSFENVKREWTVLINQCNSDLVDFGERNEIQLGSTLTAVLFANSKYYVAHVGDSRGYLIGNRNYLQITQDQSLIADEVRRGILTEEEAKNDRRKNVLLECVGITKSINIFFCSGDVLPNVCYLLCTDGFWHKVEDCEFTHYLSGSLFKDNKMLRMHLQYLVEQVKARGEKDNISVIGVVPVLV